MSENQESCPNPFGANSREWMQTVDWIQSDLPHFNTDKFSSESVEFATHQMRSKSLDVKFTGSHDLENSPSKSQFITALLWQSLYEVTHPDSRRSQLLYKYEMADAETNILLENLKGAISNIVKNKIPPYKIDKALKAEVADVLSDDNPESKLLEILKDRRKGWATVANLCVEFQKLNLPLNLNEALMQRLGMSRDPSEQGSIPRTSVDDGKRPPSRAGDGESGNTPKPTDPTTSKRAKDNANTTRESENEHGNHSDDNQGGVEITPPHNNDDIRYTESRNDILRKAKILPFSGNRNELPYKGNFRRFIGLFSAYAIGTDERTKFEVLVSHLRGQALEFFYKKLEHEPNTNYAQIVQSFCSVYFSVEHDSTKVSKFNELHQSDTMPLEQFYVEFQIAFRLIPIRDLNRTSIQT